MGRSLILALVALLVFVMVELLPGDAATAYRGHDATPEGLAHLCSTLELERPAPERFLTWIGELLHGERGVWPARREPINR